MRGPGDDNRAPSSAPTGQVAAALLVAFCLGWLLRRGWSYGVLTATILPFVAALRPMSRRLRAMLRDAVAAHRRVGVLAERFDAALDTMTHGLCMVGRDATVLVSNQRCADILRGGGSGDLEGCSFLDLLRTACGPAGGRAPADAQALLAAGAGGTVATRLADGRHAVLTIEAMRDGGAVILVEDATDRKAAEDRILRLTRFDGVTEIANRDHFIELMRAKLAEAEGLGLACALHLVGLDRFKTVNDTLGHAGGDLLLRQVARRLGELIGPGDLLGRFGGDEFLVLQTGVSEESEVAALSSRIVRTADAPFTIGPDTVRSAASLGEAATAAPLVAAAEALVQRADLALCRAKRAGRGRWCAYQPAMDDEVLERRILGADLGAALRSDAFELHFQPLVNLETMKVETCEALVRWRHPVRGVIAPAVFIPVAEEFGLIAELGARVLRMACRACRDWPDGTRVAVNLSAVQFHAYDLASVIRDALAEAGLEARRLEGEITESVLLQDVDVVRNVLEAIRATGVRIVLDDFGTGYSNLSYLNKFPLDKVKLDRSFLADLSDSVRSLTLLDGVGELGRRLGLTVVVEGIETQTQLNMVRSLGHVDEVQGYLLGRPMPRDAIEQMLHRRTRDAALAAVA